MTISFQESIIDGSFNDIINDIINDEKDYTISNDEIMYQITTSYNQKIIKKNISTVDIGNCESQAGEARCSFRVSHDGCHVCQR